MRRFRVSLILHDLPEDELPAVMETLNRVATGLALDGRDVYLGIGTEEDEDDVETGVGAPADEQTT